MIFSPFRIVLSYSKPKTITQMEESPVFIFQKGKILNEKELNIIGLKWMMLIQNNAREDKFMPYHYLRG